MIAEHQTTVSLLLLGDVFRVLSRGYREHRTPVLMGIPVVWGVATRAIGYPLLRHLPSSPRAEAPEALEQKSASVSLEVTFSGEPSTVFFTPLLTALVTQYYNCLIVLIPH